MFRSSYKSNGWCNKVLNGKSGMIYLHFEDSYYKNIIVIENIVETLHYTKHYRIIMLTM